MIYYLSVNCLAFILFWIDKRRAIKHAYRISEKTLFISILSGGIVGAFCAMQLCSHKTRHISFYIMLVISLGLHIIIHYYL